MTNKIKIYLVGGAVRDELLKKPVNDLDYVVVNGTPELMISKGFEAVGKDFPVFLHPETKEEYALARVERSLGNGTYTGFETSWEGVTLEDDLMRRDLTINAMAKDSDGNIVDPFGGQRDLENKIFRHVSEAFQEDPLRILRVARFASKMPEFRVADETLSFMRKMVKKGMINNLTSERVWKEWSRAMTYNEPRRFFEVLDDVGALKILFPVIHDMKGVPQRADYHAEGDVFVHTLMVLDKATEITKDFDEERKLLIRMGALLHDVGKTKTPHDLLYHEDGRMKGSHTGHDDVNVIRPLLTELKERYKLSDRMFNFCLDVGVYHQRIHAVKSMKKPQGWKKLFDSMKIRQRADENGEHYYLDNILLTCRADAIGRQMTIVDEVSNKSVIKDAPLEYPQLDICREQYDKYMTGVKYVGDYFELIKKHKIPFNHKESLNKLKEQAHFAAFKDLGFDYVFENMTTREQKKKLKSNKLK